MTALREAAQQALEALEALEKGVCVDPECSHRVIYALRTALAEQPAEQVPVADEPKAQHRHEWFRTGAMEPGQMRCITCGIWGREAPQPAKQPLIADEICDSWEFITGHQIQFGPSSEGRPMYLSTDEVIEFARAIELAHGIGEQE